MLSLVFCLALVGLAVGQLHPCCGPNQYEGYYNSVSGSVSGSGSDIEARLEGHRIHYDYTNKRVALFVRVYFETSGRFHSLEIHHNFNTHKLLIVDGDTCHVFPSKENMTSTCVPHNSTHVDSYYIGVGNDQLNVDAWHTPSRMGNGTYESIHIRTFRDHCIPYEYRSVFLSEHEADHSMASFVSMNRITMGIKDTSVFDTPAECQAVKYYDIPQEAKDILKFIYA